MAREYHIAAVGGSNDNEVSVDLADVLTTLGAQDWELATALPLKDSDTLLLILRRGKQLETSPREARVGQALVGAGTPSGWQLALGSRLRAVGLVAGVVAVAVAVLRRQLE